MSSRENSEKIAAAQSTVRHLLSELRDLDNVLSCTSTSEEGRRTPKSVDETRGPDVTPVTAKAKPKSKRLRISPVLLSMKEGYSPLFVRQKPAAKCSKTRTPPTPLQVWRDVEVKKKKKKREEEMGSSQRKMVVSPAAVVSSVVERDHRKSSDCDGSSVAMTPQPQPHKEASYLALRRENAKLQEEIRKLKDEKQMLKKSNEGEKKELLQRFREVRRNREDLLEDNQRLRMDQINSEKKYRRVSGRLSILDNSFHKLKAKYNALNQENIDLTFQLAHMKQDAFVYKQREDGAVKEVLEESCLALKRFEERERHLVREVEEVQNSLEDLEVQVVLLNEINRGLRGMVVSDAKKEIGQMQTVMNKRISQVHAIAEEMEASKDNIRTEVELLSEELLHKDGEVERLEAMLKTLQTQTQIIM